MEQLVDVVVLSASEGPLDPRIEQGLFAQSGVRTRLFRVTAAPRPGEPHRWQTIARGRNQGKRLGAAPWLMFLDDDVVLRAGTIAALAQQLERRPIYGALAADYLGEARAGAIAPHVSMGATLFRRAALGAIEFRSTERKCECQCACDDLRARHMAIDYLEGLGAEHVERRSLEHCAPSVGQDRGPPPASGIVLAAFDAAHAKLFREQFVASFRAAGNQEQIVAVAYGLRPRQLQAVRSLPNVQVAPRRLGFLSPARRRLVDFAAIVAGLPSDSPVAYWDAGDVVFQGRLDELWAQVRLYPDRLLAVGEPWRYPGNPAVTDWTLSITDPLAREHAFALISQRPYLNGGFLAGTAGVLLRYFRAAEHLLSTPALLGTSDWGDQTALNLYCHSHPAVWREIDERWNYCLCGRPGETTRLRDDGLFVHPQGKPICAVHGNAGTLPSRRERFASPSRS
ncbi:MAG: glycosyltransferase family 2 protein [Pirellulales bacterium]